ncbi:hypothetical protein M1I95_13585 [Rossellomorea marisflavi]|uniref:hypothetical protein n=1 Tax=Rossellomorea marisflavi TaxID=189381 RepID=UPI0027A44EE5|nr:hypothetical protein [Rossellomorea marisflavi]UTE71323.1 hypothetical protein M1I95_13585 [Rossellomorea marisflavi]
MMTNSLPFLILVILSLMVLGFLMMTNRDQAGRIIVFWLFISGLAYVFEFLIFILGGSYEYDPAILSNQYNDSVLGSISSQAFSVPISLTVIAVKRLKFGWILLIIAFFYFIESWFVSVGIYEHFWWKSIYTSIFLLLGAYLSKKWWKRMADPGLEKLHFITLYFSLSVLTLSISWILSPLLDLYKIPLSLFSDEMRDSITGNSIYSWVCNYLYTLNIFYRPNNTGAFWITLLILMILDYGLIHFNFLAIRGMGGIFTLPLFHIAMLLLGKKLFSWYGHALKKTAEH